MEPPPLTSSSEDQRQKAMDKFRIIQPYLHHEKTLKEIVDETGVAGLININSLD